MARHKNANWQLPDGQLQNWEQVHVAVMMDVREELQTTNALLRQLLGVFQCQNAQEIPHTLQRIERRLATHMPLKLTRKKKHATP